MSRIIGIVPARAGSKGIPGKNIKLLGNKPLLYYTALSSTNSKKLCKTILSTDSLEIAEIGKKFGLEVPFLRPMKLAQDNTPSYDVIMHAILYMERKFGEIYEIICLLQPTSPFRPKGFIDRALSMFVEQDADSLISVLPVPHSFNPHWIFEEKGGFLRISTGENRIISSRQALPKAYLRDGAIYIFKRQTLLEKHSLYGDKIAYIEGSWDYHVNLDSPDDWNKAINIMDKIELESFF
jgi:CMP-N,N'-diacetyllegionaminic acid synthase